MCLDSTSVKLILVLVTQEKLHLCIAQAMLLHESLECNYAVVNLLVGSWNVRSLVEGSGDARTCRSRPMNVVGSEMVDSKVDLLVKELKRY